MATKVAFFIVIRNDKGNYAQGFTPYKSSNRVKSYCSQLSPASLTAFMPPFPTCLLTNEAPLIVIQISLGFIIRHDCNKATDNLYPNYEIELQRLSGSPGRIEPYHDGEHRVQHSDEIQVWLPPSPLLYPFFVLLRTRIYHCTAPEISDTGKILCTRNRDFRKISQYLDFEIEKRYI